MRRPLDRRCSDFCRLRLVLTRFASALTAETLVTTENDAIAGSSLNVLAGVPADPARGSMPSSSEVVIGTVPGGFNRLASSRRPHVSWRAPLHETARHCTPP